MHFTFHILNWREILHKKFWEKKIIAPRRGESPKMSTLELPMTPLFFIAESFSTAKSWKTSSKINIVFFYNFLWLQASPHHLKHYPYIQHENGLQTAILGLEFQVFRAHLFGASLELDLRCTSGLSARVTSPDHPHKILEHIHQVGDQPWPSL